MTRAINASALKQRADVKKLNAELAAQLASEGLTFFEVDVSSFQRNLKDLEFYSE